MRRTLSLSVTTFDRTGLLVGGNRFENTHGLSAATLRQIGEGLQIAADWFINRLPTSYNQSESVCNHEHNWLQTGCIPLYSYKSHRSRRAPMSLCSQIFVLRQLRHYLWRYF